MPKNNYFGNWWLPQYPTVKLSGTISIEEDGSASLELHGNFLGTDGLFLTLEDKLILGQCGPFKFSLYQLIGRSGFDEGGIKTRYAIRFVITGRHFKSADNIMFKSINVKFRYLDEWVGIFGFKSPGKLNHRTFGVHYKIPANKMILSYENWNISIRFSASCPRAPIYKNKATIKQDVYIKFTSKQNCHLNDYYEIISYFQNFLSLCLRYPTYPTELFVGRSYKVVSGLDHKRISIITPQPEINNLPDNILPFKMLSTYSNIRNRIGSYLTKWIRSADKIGHVYQLLLAPRYLPDMYLKFHFLSYAQALESFHRRIKDKKYVTLINFKKIREDMLDAINPQHRSWLGEKSKYLNQWSFRKCLKDILGMYPGIFKKLKGFDKSLADSIVDTRNYYTHYSVELEPKAAKGRDLFLLTERTQALLEIYLLKYLGFRSDFVLNTISRNRRFI